MEKTYTNEEYKKVLKPYKEIKKLKAQLSRLAIIMQRQIIMLQHAQAGIDFLMCEEFDNFNNNIVTLRQICLLPMQMGRPVMKPHAKELAAMQKYCKLRVKMLQREIAKWQKKKRFPK